MTSPSAVSPGLSISKDNPPIHIFDLDGTILSINSFPRWVLYMLTSGKPVWMIKAALVLGKRKLGLLSHAAAKQDFQKLWTEYANEKDLHAFTAQLLKTVRPAMADLLNIEGDKILSTAAAAEYAIELGRALGFDYIISTTPHGAEFIENVRENKRDRTMGFLKEKGWAQRPRIFFTDHAEDMPLIEQSHIVFWYGKDDDAPVVEDVEIYPVLTQPSSRIRSILSSRLQAPS